MTSNAESNQSDRNQYFFVEVDPRIDIAFDYLEECKAKNKSLSNFTPNTDHPMCKEHLRDFFERWDQLRQLPSFEPFLKCSPYELMAPIFGIYPLDGFEKINKNEFNGFMDVIEFFSVGGPVEQFRDFHNGDPRLIIILFNWPYSYIIPKHKTGNCQNRNLKDSHWFLNDFYNAFEGTEWHKKKLPEVSEPPPERKVILDSIVANSKQRLEQYFQSATKIYTPNSVDLKTKKRYHYYCGHCKYISMPDPMKCDSRFSQKYYHSSCVIPRARRQELTDLREVNDIKCQTPGCTGRLPIEVNDINLMPRQELINLFKGCRLCEICNKYHLRDLSADDLKLECNPNSPGLNLLRDKVSDSPTEHVINYVNDMSCAYGDTCLCPPEKPKKSRKTNNNSSSDESMYSPSMGDYSSDTEVDVNIELAPTPPMKKKKPKRRKSNGSTVRNTTTSAVDGWGDDEDSGLLFDPNVTSTPKMKENNRNNNHNSGSGNSGDKSNDISLLENVPAFGDNNNASPLKSPPKINENKDLLESVPLKDINNDTKPQNKQKSINVQNHYTTGGETDSHIISKRGAIGDSVDSSESHFQKIDSIIASKRAHLEKLTKRFECLSTRVISGSENIIKKKISELMERKSELWSTLNELNIDLESLGNPQAVEAVTQQQQQLIERKSNELKLIEHQLKTKEQEVNDLQTKISDIDKQISAELESNHKLVHSLAIDSKNGLKLIEKQTNKALKCFESMIDKSVTSIQYLINDNSDKVFDINNNSTREDAVHSSRQSVPNSSDEINEN